MNFLILWNHKVVCLSAAPIDIVPDSRYFALSYNHFMQAGVDLQ